MSNALRGSLIIGQSGGPSAVINASAYGVIKTALKAEDITAVYGAHYGIKGVLNDDLFVMDEEDPAELKKLPFTPSSALGSCRYKLKSATEDENDYKRVLEIFKKYNVRYFCYNGGNDSMDTCNKISKYLRAAGYECKVMGIPKTIDNDLEGTDHSPGYGSAAKYIATSIMEVAKDTAVYDTGTVTIVECMGRHAGWLTAAASLANIDERLCDAIYLPEVDFDMDKFIANVDDIFKVKKNALIAVSEGIHYADGSFVSEAETSATDGFGHAQLGGLASRLAAKVHEKLSVKTRGIELSLLQRCSSHLASKTDILEAFSVGKYAVEKMLLGETDYMVGIKADRSNGYSAEPTLVSLSEAANNEKKFPLEWISPNGHDIERGYLDYALPLIQGETDMPKVDALPDFAKLKKVRA